jgi:hypothetical protein
MQRALVAWCGWLVFLGLAGAAEPQNQLDRDTWEAAYLEGAKVGFVHTTVRAQDRDGQQALQVVKELNLTVKRFNDTASIRVEVGNVETKEGKVRAVHMKYYLAKGLQMVVRGTVEDDMLHIQGEPPAEGGQRLDKRIPWNDEAIGMNYQDQLFRVRKVKPGDRFSYLSYDPEVTNVITMRASVKDFEEVPGAGGKSQRLLRVQEAADKIAGISLPPLTIWLNEKWEPVRSQTDIPGLGQITFVRTSRQEALRQGNGQVQVKNIGTDQLIPLDHRIPNAYDTISATYRITSKGDDDPLTLFARDGRQKINKVGDKSVEITVQAITEPEAQDAGAEVGEEYLKSCFFITSDDPLVRQHAREAIGRAQDPWERAKRIERWVHQRMENKNFSEAFAPASHVAKTLEGDCTEHAMLAAAMCRAAGIPARAAVGLIYVDHRTKGPVMGFHMWTEVHVRGRWVPIDATLGRGFVGASHLKISDHSWYDTQSLKPLLPTVRVLSSKIGIEVVRANGAE